MLIQVPLNCDAYYELNFVTKAIFLLNVLRESLIVILVKKVLISSFKLITKQFVS